MSFIAPEWDNDVLGDQTHSNLFQKNKFKAFPKQKSKKNKGITTKNNDTKISKQNDENTSKISSPNQQKLKKKLKRLNTDKVQQPKKLEVNNFKQINKKGKGKNTINDGGNNNKQNTTGLIAKPKSPKKENAFAEKQSKKGLQKKLQRLQKENSNSTINNLEIEARETDHSENKKSKKKLKKQRQKAINTKQNISVENSTDKNKTNDETMKNLNKHDKKKLKKQKLQNENTDVEENYEMQNVSNKTKTKQPDNPEKRERNKLKKKLKKKLKRLQKQNEKNKDSKKQINSKLGINIDALTKALEMQVNTESKAKNFTNSLREKMQDKLKAARFRFLNEQMYTNEGKDAQKLFKSDPDAFKAYHDGYRQQVARWPLNPLDTIIKRVKKLPKEYVVADFGCGDARLSNSVPQKVHSFDLVAKDPSVTACDMAHVPLKNNSVDVAVFCLSLMGTNLKDYLFEANRVLKIGGIITVAEVESRFDQVEVFIDGLQRYGFVNTWKDLSHNLFYFLEFKKERDIKYKNKLPTISLHPCLYKKR